MSASMVSMPCPIAAAPEATATAPDGSTATVADSNGPRPVPLDEIGEPDAARPPAQRRRAAALREPLPAGGFERGSHAARIIAAVEHHLAAAPALQRTGTRHAFRADQVALPDRDAVDPEPVRRRIQQALHGEHRLRMPGAPDRGHRHLVGQRRARDQPVGRDVVGQRDRERGFIGQVGAARGIGAVIVHHRPAHAPDRAVGVERGLDVPELVALLGAGDEMLAPILDPLDRPAEQEGGERHRDLLRIGDELGPEPAADRRRDHANAARLAPQHPGDQVAPGMRRLGRAPEGEQIVDRVEPGERAAPLDRMPAAAMDGEAGGKDAASGEGGLDVAEFHDELGEQVVIAAAVDRRSAGGERIAAVGDRREGLVIHLGQRRRVLGRVARVRDDHRDHLADMDDLVVGKQGTVVLLAVGGARQADDQAVLGEVGSQVVQRPDRMHAGHRLRRVDVDVRDRRMTQRTPHERRVQGSRQMDVVDEARPPAQQRRILDPRVRHLLQRAGRVCRGRSACRSGRR